MSPHVSLEKPLEREDSELKDKVIFLTGASKGLGEALGQALLKEGSKLVLLSRSQIEVTPAQQESTLALCVDVSDPVQVKKAVNTPPKAVGFRSLVPNFSNHSALRYEQNRSV